MGPEQSEQNVAAAGVMSASGSSSEKSYPGFPTPQQFFTVLVGYFAWQVIARVMLSSSLDLDESEQVVLCQKLSWGYGPQPPLYTWIQIGFFSVFGQSVFALSLFKNLLLFSTVVITYWNARLVTGSSACGVAAAISMFYIPSVAWESQRDLTHSVLASTFATATLFSFLRLVRERRMRWYLMLGVCAGCGLISKYNFCLWVIGLVLAALSLREFRPAVRDKRMFLSLTIFLLIFLPNLLWILYHRDLAFSTAFKFKLGGSGAGWLASVLIGLCNLFVTLVSFIGPLAGLYAVIFLKAQRRPSALGAASGYGKLILRALLAVVAVLILLVLCFRATDFRERWLQPALICIPVLAITLVRDRLDSSRLRWMVGIGCIVMVTVSVAIPARIVFARPLKKKQRLDAPYRDLALDLRSKLPASAFVVADTKWLAGNLHLALPDKTALTVDLLPIFPKQGSHCVLVWDATEHDLPPNPVIKWAQLSAPGDLSRAEPQYVTAPYRFDPSRRLRLGILQIN